MLSFLKISYTWQLLAWVIDSTFTETASIIFMLCPWCLLTLSLFSMSESTRCCTPLRMSNTWAEREKKERLNQKEMPAKNIAEYLTEKPCCSHESNLGKETIRKRMHMTEVEIQLNHQSKITENVVVRLIINSSHESTKCGREIALPVITSLLGNSLKPEQYHFFHWKIWMGTSGSLLKRGSCVQESSVWAQRRDDPAADANAIFSLIGLCAYCACASQTQLIAHYYSLGFLLSHSASPTLRFKAPYFNFMTGQSVAKSSLLSASVILAHLILALPVLGSPHTACPPSFLKFPPPLLKFLFPLFSSCLCLYLEANPLPLAPCAAGLWCVRRWGCKKTREIRKLVVGKGGTGDGDVHKCGCLCNFCPVKRVITAKEKSWWKQHIYKNISGLVFIESESSVNTICWDSETFKQLE